VGCFNPLFFILSVFVRSLPDAPTLLQRITVMIWDGVPLELFFGLTRPVP